MIVTDWLAIKTHHWRLIIMAALLLIFTFSGMSMALIPISAYMGMAFSLNTFAVEEKGKLQHLYLSFPLLRSSIVRGRYAFMLFCVLVSLAVTSVLTYFFMPTLKMGTFRYDIDPRIIIMLCSIGYAFGSLINICMYPTMFRLGYEKGKVLGLYIPLGFIGVLFGGATVYINHSDGRFLRLLTYVAENPGKVTTYVTLIAFGIGTLLYFGSYCLSQRVYARRSF
ncbi:MAG: ABC-2 transporter permease [Clostridium sp.]|nr:ABC-2 transporter permease [Clostridium sp.]